MPSVRLSLLQKLLLPPNTAGRAEQLRALAATAWFSVLAPGGAVALTAVLADATVHAMLFQFALLPVGLNSDYGGVCVRTGKGVAHHALPCARDAGA